jgi:Glycosyl transferase 4-like domain
MSRRVLMLTPHFPPDGNAATHRVRLLAPHLPKYGWEPTLVAIDPRDYEGSLDERLLSLVPPDLRVARCRAWDPQWTRTFGIGDLGIRSFTGLRRTCSDLLARERFDALFITIYPSYTALLGPMLKRRFGVPFVLDYQDPWVGEWGRTVGGGRGHAVDVKSRLTRTLAGFLEPRVVAAADAVTAVSSGTYEGVRERYPDRTPTVSDVIPVGGEEADVERVRALAPPNPFFDGRDGRVHLSSVGALLPLGAGPLRAFLAATALVKHRRPDLYARLRLHFFGSSNQVAGSPQARAVPVAQEFDVADSVDEHALRISYVDSLSVQLDSTALLLIGSQEPHYTASRIYPALLIGRPIVAIYHTESSAAEVLRRAAPPPTVRLVTVGTDTRIESVQEPLFEMLCELLENPGRTGPPVDPRVIAACSAETLAGRLASVLSAVAGDRARC